MKANIKWINKNLVKLIAVYRRKWSLGLAFHSKVTSAMAISKKTAFLTAQFRLLRQRGYTADSTTTQFFLLIIERWNVVQSRNFECLIGRKRAKADPLLSNFYVPLGFSCTSAGWASRHSLASWSDALLTVTCQIKTTNLSYPVNPKKLNRTITSQVLRGEITKNLTTKVVRLKQESQKAAMINCFHTVAKKQQQ